jgi:hypothetical protein
METSTGDLEVITTSVPNRRRLFIIGATVILIVVAAYLSLSAKSIVIAVAKPYDIKVSNGVSFFDFETDSRRFYNVHFWGRSCNIRLTADNKSIDYIIGPEYFGSDHVSLPKY